MGKWEPTLVAFPSDEIYRSARGSDTTWKAQLLRRCSQLLEGPGTSAGIAIDAARLEEFCREISPEDVEVSVAKSSPSRPTAEMAIQGAEESEDAAAADVKASLAKRVGSNDFSSPETLRDIARILAYNVMNFSFYPDAGEERWWIDVEGIAVGKDDEAFAIVESLKRWERAIGNASCWTDGSYLQEMDEVRLREIFAPAEGAGKLPLLDLRLKCLRTLGDCIVKHGSLQKFLTSCLAESRGVRAPDRDGDVPMMDVRVLCGMLAASIPALRDVRAVPAEAFGERQESNGTQEGARGGELYLEFAKRTQLTCSMLAADGLVNFGRDFEQHMTAFSDYRLPQILIHKGVVRIPEELQRRIKCHEPLAEGSREEVGLRAATLLAAERLRESLEKRFAAPVKITNVDYFLWRTSVKLEVSGEISLPFHKTRGCCY